MKFTQSLFLLFIAFSLLMGCASSEDKPDMASMPDGSIRIENWNIGALATMTVGKGELTFKNKVYNFEIGGMGTIGVGVDKITATGQVHNLEDIDDFPGKYFEVKASGTIVVGAGGIAMENDKGVVIKLTSGNKGLNLALGPKGITITLK